MNPTGSFKDTGMTAALSVAVASGYEWVACASTGNTSAAMAAYAARAGLRSLVLIPRGRLRGASCRSRWIMARRRCQLRRTLMAACGADEIVQRAPIYLLNSVNPYRLEGQKTPAFEILEQMDWQVPHHIDRAGRKPGELLGAGQGVCGDEASGVYSPGAEDQRDPGRGANPLYRSMKNEWGGPRAGYGGTRGLRRFGLAIRRRGRRR
jgi:threonine synthase